VGDTAPCSNPKAFLWFELRVVFTNRRLAPVYGLRLNQGALGGFHQKKVVEESLTNRTKSQAGFSHAVSCPKR